MDIHDEVALKRVRASSNEVHHKAVLPLHLLNGPVRVEDQGQHGLWVVPLQAVGGLLPTVSCPEEGCPVGSGGLNDVVLLCTRHGLGGAAVVEATLHSSGQREAGLW